MLGIALQLVLAGLGPPHLPHPQLQGRQLQLLRQLLGRAVAVVGGLHHNKRFVGHDLRRRRKMQCGRGKSSDKDP